MDLLGTVSRVRLDQGGLKMMKKLLASLSASVTHPFRPLLPSSPTEEPAPSPLSILILLFHSASPFFRAFSLVLLSLFFSSSLFSHLSFSRFNRTSTSSTSVPFTVKTTYRPYSALEPIHPRQGTPSTFRSTITYGSIGYGR